MKKRFKDILLFCTGIILIATSAKTICLKEDYTDLNNKYNKLYQDYKNLTENSHTLLSSTKADNKKTDQIIVDTSKEELTLLEEAGKKYDIDPLLLESIERLETGHYTSDLYFSNNNTWGAFDGINYLSFESVEQSTMTLAETLRLYYFDQGLDTIDDIGKKYCPDDPKWSSKVKSIYIRLQNGEI